MNSFLFIAAAITLFPVGLAMYFRTNVGMMFLSGCCGLMMLSVIDPVVAATAGSLIPTEGEGYIRLAVVALSIVFAAVLFRHTIGGGKLALHITIALLLGLTLLLLLPSTVGLSWLLDLIVARRWQYVNSFRMFIYMLGFSLSLIAVLLSMPKSHHKSKH